VRTLLPRSDLLQYSSLGETALHASVFDSSGSVFDLLLAAFAERYGRDQGVDCRTLATARADEPQGVGLTVGNSAGVGERVNGGAHRQTALHRAAAGGAHGALRKLLAAGAKRMALDSMLRTPLHYAARATSLACIGLLIAGPPGCALVEGEECEGSYYAGGGDDGDCGDGGVGPAGVMVPFSPSRLGRLTAEQVDARDISGQTALYYAAFVGSIACTRALLAVGADPLAARPDGYTPLSVAQMRHGGSIALRELIVMLGGGGGGGGGRGVIAPLRLHAAPSSREALCDCCGLPGELAAGGKLKLCICAAAVYCSKECQKADYSFHKADCKSRRAAAEAAAQRGGGGKVLQLEAGPAKKKGSKK
jgi:hypothetical protein